MHTTTKIIVLTFQLILLGSELLVKEKCEFLKLLKILRGRDK